MDLTRLEQKIETMLSEHGFRLMRLFFVTEDKERYLRVIVDKYHHRISLDEIVTLSGLIDTFIDEDDDNQSFILDVTTTGAEKEVALTEIKDYVDTGIYVTMKDGVKGPQTIEGLLLNVSDTNLTVKVNNKGRMQERVVLLTDIKTLRRAILM